jgi:ApaG protein
MDQEYSKQTKGVLVTVRPIYLDEQSRPEEGHFVWAYQVQIANHGPHVVQLLRRSWSITDARGRVQVVTGDGVVGEQPVLRPGQAFEYTSGAPLETPSGFMVGQFHMMVVPTGELFDADIPAFSLDSPYQSKQVH